MKMWSGRFESETDKSADDFNSSLRFDKALFAYDIEGSIAHVRMLEKQKVISEGDAVMCADALRKLKEQVFSGKYAIGETYEDVHMAVKRF